MNWFAEPTSEEILRISSMSLIGLQKCRSYIHGPLPQARLLKNFFSTATNSGNEGQRYVWNRRGEKGEDGGGKGEREISKISPIEDQAAMNQFAETESSESPSSIPKGGASRKESG